MMADQKMPAIEHKTSISVKEMSHKFTAMTTGHKRVPIRRHINVGNLSKRLHRRKELFRKRQWIVDLEFLFAMVGIAVMVIYLEIYYMINYGNLVRFILEMIIMLTTVLLIAMVGLYHWTGINICMLDNGLENWRLAVSSWTVIKIITECIVCAIQPMPEFIIRIHGTNHANASFKPTDSQWNKEHDHNREVPTNVILSLMMLCRLYLIGRMAVVHSDRLIDASIHSYGALCKVKINAQFIFRALMSTHPCWILATILVLIFICTSWSMHTCERLSYAKGDDSSAIQSMWLIAITFLTVGYGDLVPVSTCGRIISVLTGLSGVGIVALMVAVLSNKLEQTRAEKCIYSFIRRMRLENTHKNAAADVIKQAVNIYKLRRNGHLECDSQLIQHRRKFLKAVSLMREATVLDLQIKQSEIELVDLQNSLVDLNEITIKNTTFQNEIIQRVTSIETCLYELNKCIKNLNRNQ